MELWVLRLGKYALGFLGHSRILGAPYSAALHAPRIRTVLGGAGRRLLDMGGLRPRLGISAVEAEQLS